MKRNITTDLILENVPIGMKNNILSQAEMSRHRIINVRQEKEKRERCIISKRVSINKHAQMLIIYNERFKIQSNLNLDSCEFIIELWLPSSLVKFFEARMKEYDNHRTI